MGTEPLRFCQTCKLLGHIWHLEPVFYRFRDDGVCHCCKRATTADDSTGMVLNVWRRR